MPKLAERGTRYYEREECKTREWQRFPLLLMRIADPVERAFYEREATERNWSFRQLERMYRTSTFERLQIPKDCLMVKLLSLLGVLEYGRLAA